MVQSCGPPRSVPLTMNFPLGRVHNTRRGARQCSLHTCRLTAPRLWRICDRDVECVCATMLRPIWRALNLYRFPFPGLCYSISGAAPCNQCNPPPSSPCNAISPINSPPFKTQKPNSLWTRRVCVCVYPRAVRQSLPNIWRGLHFGSCDGGRLAA